MSAATLKLVESKETTSERLRSKSNSSSPKPPRKTKAASPEAKKRAASPKPRKRDAQAADLMSSPAVACSVDATLNDAARLMWENDLGVVVVVDDEGRPISMLTDRDISMAAYTQGVPLYHAAVTSAMSRSLVKAQTTTTVDDLRAMMTESGVRRIPVVDAAGRLCGIVGLSDVISESLAGLPKDRKRGTSAAMLVQLMHTTYASKASVAE